MNKTVLITGASSGIGKEFAYEYAAQGYNIILTARRTEKLQEMYDHLTQHYEHIKIYIYSQDLSKDNAAFNIFNFVQSQQIDVDILINNAGFGDLGYFHETNPEVNKNMIMVNILALTELTRYFLPTMIEKNEGAILNVASTAAFLSGPFMSIYFATKAYVLSFTEALANEVQEYNISITALCPGATKTEFQDNANISSISGFKTNTLPTAKDVALFGIESIEKKKTIAIHGHKNQLLTFLPRLFPRKFLTKMVRKTFIGR